MSIVEATGGITHTKVDVSASGDNTLVAAVAGKRIRVLSMAVVAAGSVSVTFKSGSTDLTGAMSLSQGVPLESVSGWGAFQTAAGEALVLNLSGAVQTSGWLTYQTID